MFGREFDKTLKSTKSLVSIKESKCLMKSFDITIENETHTLGHLLQSHINQFFKDRNIFVGYMNPHPLEKKIVIRIKVDDINELKDIILETKTRLIKMCDNLLGQFKEQFKGLIIPKVVIGKPKGKLRKKKSKEKKKVAEAEDDTEGGAPYPKSL